MTKQEYCDWLMRFDPALHEIVDHYDEKPFVNQDLFDLPFTVMRRLYIRDKQPAKPVHPYECHCVYVVDERCAGYVGFKLIGKIVDGQLVMEEG